MRDTYLEDMDARMDAAELELNLRGSAALRSYGDFEKGEAVSDTLDLALTNIDWGQVVSNGGPPCFHLEDDGRFCLRAERWIGHEEVFHQFVSLRTFIFLQRAEEAERCTKAVEELWKQGLPADFTRRAASLRQQARGRK